MNPIRKVGDPAVGQFRRSQGSALSYKLPIFDMFMENDDRDATTAILHESVCKCTEDTYLVDARCKGSTHRRAVIDHELRLFYWDVKCTHFANPRSCPYGMKCPFAHTQAELTMHPAKYKTEACTNSAEHDHKECPYSHGDECRVFAPEMYSLEHAKSTTDPEFSDAYDWNNFLMFKFKTEWCPIQHVHNWSTCVFAHHYGDMRRDPKIKYGTQPCPNVSDQMPSLETNYLSVCPDGFRCPYAHNAKERVYHPIFYRTVPCKFKSGVGCPMGQFCTFSHGGETGLHRPATTVTFSELLDQKNLKFLQRSMYTFPPLVKEQMQSSGKPSKAQLEKIQEVEDAKLEWASLTYESEVTTGKKSKARKKKTKKKLVLKNPDAIISLSENLGLLADEKPRDMFARPPQPLYLYQEPHGIMPGAPLAPLPPAHAPPPGYTHDQGHDPYAQRNKFFQQQYDAYAKPHGQNMYQLGPKPGEFVPGMPFVPQPHPTFEKPPPPDYMHAQPPPPPPDYGHDYLKPQPPGYQRRSVSFAQGVDSIADRVSSAEEAFLARSDSQARMSLSAYALPKGANWSTYSVTSAADSVPEWAGVNESLGEDPYEMDPEFERRKSAVELHRRVSAAALAAPKESKRQSRVTFESDAPPQLPILQDEDDILEDYNSRSRSKSVFVMESFLQDVWNNDGEELCGANASSAAAGLPRRHTVGSIWSNGTGLGMVPFFGDESEAWSNVDRSSARNEESSPGESTGRDTAPPELKEIAQDFFTYLDESPPPGLSPTLAFPSMADSPTAPPSQ